jgi:hypothetical protein
MTKPIRTFFGRPVINLRQSIFGSPLLNFIQSGIKMQQVDLTLFITGDKAEKISTAEAQEASKLPEEK